MNKQKLERGRGYALLLRQKRSRKPAFVAVKAANATRNKDAAHRFRAASFAGALCVKRTAKTGVRPGKMSKLIFPDCRRFSYARKLSLRSSSYRRKLFAIVFKPVRPLRSRRRSLLAQSSRPRRPRTSPSPFANFCLSRALPINRYNLRCTAPASDR